MCLLTLETRDEKGVHDRPDKRLSGLPGPPWPGQPDGLSWRDKSPAASPVKRANGFRRLALIPIHHTPCPQDMHRMNWY